MQCIKEAKITIPKCFNLELVKHLNLNHLLFLKKLTFINLDFNKNPNNLIHDSTAKQLPKILFLLFTRGF